MAHDSFHTLVFSAGENETGVEIKAVEDGTELILVSSALLDISRFILKRLLQVAGEPLDQTVFQYGPFVMTTKEEIQKTLLDCKSPKA